MKRTFFLLALVAMLFAACDEKNKPEENDDNGGNNTSSSITCDPTSKTVSTAGDSFVVTIKANAAWSASANQSWVTIDPKTGQGDASVTVTVAAGDDGTAQVLFSNGNSTATLTIQRGNSPTPPTPSTGDGVLSGEFSVSATEKVHFSQGNLQATYDGSSWTWSFATNQWDYIGDAAANTAITGNISSNGTVDLFGWSTASTYYGMNNSKNESDYPGEFVEWGNNPISNGGNTANMWHTLKAEEWYYLVNTRTDASNKYGAAKVNGVIGIVLLPDDWTLPSGCGFTPGMTSASSWDDWSLVASTNIYDGDAWSAMEKAGAVFLPAAGYRYGTGVYRVGSYGGYWSSTPIDTGLAYNLNFYSDGLDPQYNGTRDYGLSVRLVR